MPELGKKNFNNLQFGCVPTDFFMRLHRNQAYLCEICEEPTMASYTKQIGDRLFCFKCFTKIMMACHKENYYRFESFEGPCLVREFPSSGINIIENMNKNNNYKKLES